MIRVFEAFAGYGSQSLALERLNIPHKVVCISEIDKYAIQAYKALHGNVLNLGDISKINEFEVPEHDLFTYSFPCQDISVAGLQKGITESTRSGLLWECERIIKAKRPKYLLMENVKNLVSKKFKTDFDKWCMWLEGQGYANYWKVLNAKDYGIPQNRERVFMISILGEHDPYVFPEGFDNGIRLKDMLEDEVEEKYYISEEKTSKLTVQDRYGILENSPIRIGNIYGEDKGTGFAGNVWSKEAISPTLTTMQGGNRQPMTLLDYRIRKLTPRECFRLMGLHDDEIGKIQQVGISNSQQYKLAGNSIVVDVLEYIFASLFDVNFQIPQGL